MYQWTLYDHGRALQSAFWRNDAAVLRMAGAVDLPHDLYPDAVPWVAFLRALEAPQAGAEGILNQQITPYSYVGQDVSAKSIERITVPAGTFSALKVIAQVDIATIMPNWPRFVLHVIKPVIPSNTLYFAAAPPYRLLKQEGATFVGGPEVTTELIRFYIAGAPQPVMALPTVAVAHAPVAAVLGEFTDYPMTDSLQSDGVLFCRHDSFLLVACLVTHYLTVSQTDQTVRPFHDLRIVGGKNESRTGGTIETFHHVEKRDSSGRVQIRCGLVRQNERRFRDHGAGHGNPLLLPSGQLRRTPIFKALKADLRKQLFHPLLAHLPRHALQEEGKFRIFQRREDRQQIVSLENEADALQTHTRQFA